jgi:hypothetical protein
MSTEFKDDIQNKLDRTSEKILEDLRIIMVEVAEEITDGKIEAAKEFSFLLYS